MQAGYFQTAWNDIKHTEGWAKKIALLALLQFIPIFGQIVLYGYLYGWARDIAWNIHQPMPARIFGNEDNKFYSRGFFIFVIGFVFALIPSLISAATSIPMDSSSNVTTGILTIALSGSLISFVLALIAQVLAWVGSMRTAIYGRLGPGFQLGKIWKMIQFDTEGIMRIIGMVLLISLILGTIFGIVIALLGGGAIISLAATGTLSSGHIDDLAAVLPTLGFGSILILAAIYALMFGTTWLEALQCRALGYWTRQFNVPAWGGQDDLLPFERSSVAQQAQQAQYAAQVEYTQAQAEAAQVQGQKIEYQNQKAQQQYEQAAAQQPVQPTADQMVAPGQQPASPDWIAQVNATAPAEQRSPYTTPAHATPATPADAVAPAVPATTADAATPAAPATPADAALADAAPVDAATSAVTTSQDDNLADGPFTPAPETPVQTVDPDATQDSSDLE